MIQVRLDILAYVKQFKHIPDEYKDFINGFVIHAVDNLFRSINMYMGAVELVFRRTRDHPDIKTKHEIEKANTKK